MITYVAIDNGYLMVSTANTTSANTNHHYTNRNETTTFGNETITYGKRLMDTASASLWNFLPDEIKCAPNIIIFKRHLKTYLFI